MSSLGPVTTPDIAKLERRSWYIWTGLIAGFFVVQFSMSIVAIVLATSDPTHSVVPNYHQQAMEHDKVLAARHASEKLGWKWSISVDELQSKLAVRGFTVQLKDAQGNAIEGAEVAVELCHHARGNQIQKVRLIQVPQQPGTYHGEAMLDRSGVWQIDLNVHRQAEHFIDRAEKFWSFAS
jgi:nitrogen fixation protein FixH